MARHEVTGGHAADTPTPARARRLLHEAFVVDLHADTPTASFLRPDYDFGARHESGHVDLPRLRDAGVDAQFLVAWVPGGMASTPGRSFRYAVTVVEAIRRVVDRTPGVRLVGDAAGLLATRADGEAAALIGIEGGHAIEGSLENLRRLHALGARYLTLTWNNSNDWADAAGDVVLHGGLSPFGRRVVRELHRLRMLVDLSHVAESTFWDALDESSIPVIASHSNARRLADHHRNLTDDQLRAIARTGGVVGLNAFPAFLDTAYGLAYDQISRDTLALETRLRDDGANEAAAHGEAEAWLQRQLATLPPVPVSAMAEHADHIAQVAGVDHVGLGCDFDGIPSTPFEFPDISALPRLIELLLHRGWSDDDVRKLVGGNVLRVLGAVFG